MLQSLSFPMLNDRPAGNRQSRQRKIKEVTIMGSKRKDQEVVIFRLPADVKKELRMQVLKEGISIQKLLEDFVCDYLGMRKD